MGAEETEPVWSSFWKEKTDGHSFDLELPPGLSDPLGHPASNSRTARAEAAAREWGKRGKWQWQ